MNYVVIFQGGGVKAIAHLGAIKALEERGFRCVKAAGSSAGAIVASLLIVGYNADELKEIIMNLDITKMKERENIIKVVQGLGLYSSSPLEEYLNSLYKNKDKQIYRDLFDGIDYKLKVIGTDIIKRKQIIMPDDLSKYNINPHTFNIARSVVMSATYPLFYKPFKLNKTLVMDGSITNDFPLDVFEYNKKIPVIGFNLLGENQIKDHLGYPYIIRIPTFGIKSMKFNITLQDKQRLYYSGYNAAKQFLNRFFAL